VIISTGMANLDEIGHAVQAARNAGCGDLALLYCVSGYPTPAEDANLRTLRDMAERFDVVVGLSDHTTGTAVAVAAVALGAAIVEKHVTLSRDDGSLDAAFSLEPSELKLLCDSADAAAKALGRVNYTIKPSEQGNIGLRRSLFVVEDMPAGTKFTPQNVRSLRPALGLPPRHLKELIGRTAAVAIQKGTPLTWDLVS